ncbi:hypothetical protein [Streptomyces sp. YIM 98790]|uniref:hypothetical protein n=1 Tax=Streptomyces sp. YIM 98790 TaxID=2689077 RepID=UPI00140D2290|nr:hypothetical protein [Streptomyces sp. YIM 98790]
MQALSDRLGDYALHYALVHAEFTRTMSGRPRDGFADASPIAERAAVQRRNSRAAELFTGLLPYSTSLLHLARSALEAMTPAPHHPGWHLLLDDLAHAAQQARHLVESHPEAATDPSAAAERDAALWPYATTWAERSRLVRDLAEHHRPRTPMPQLDAEVARQLTEQVRAARTARSLGLLESWYDASGRIITLAWADDQNNRVLAIAGDLDGPDMHVVARFPTDREAWQCLPPAVPAGVLQPGLSRETAPELPPKVTTEELTAQVLRADAAGEVSEALHYATEEGTPYAGPLAELRDFVTLCAEFSEALETRAGLLLAARLHAADRQLSAVRRELEDIAEEMGEQISVLPPHRLPLPRHLPAPAPAPRPTTAACVPGAPPAAPPGRRR